MLFLAGLPFAHFFNNELDIWHAQTWWVHGALVLLMGMWMWGPSAPLPRNRPLACWFVWVSLMSLQVFTSILVVTKKYPLSLFVGWGHLLSILLMYCVATSLLDVDAFSRLWRWVARAGVVVMGYCVLQLLHLDQFYANIDNKIAEADLLVGTIGNPSHLGAYLALLLPVFLAQPGRRWKLAVGLDVLLLLLTKSRAGWIAASVSVLWWMWHTHRRWMPLVGVLLGIGGTIIVFNHGSINTSGRWAVWNAFYTLLQERPITGFGPGFVMDYSSTITSGFLHKWRHVHNEYLQLIVEQGIIGLGFVLWGIWDVLARLRRVEKTPLVILAGGVFLAFLVNAFVNFPAHLWLLGSLGLFAYATRYRPADLRRSLHQAPGNNTTAAHHGRGFENGVADRGGVRYRRRNGVEEALGVLQLLVRRLLLGGEQFVQRRPGLLRTEAQFLRAAPRHAASHDVGQADGGLRNADGSLQ